MKTMKLFTLILLTCIGSALFAAGQTPEDGYRTYLKALEKAEHLTDLDPYIPAHLVNEREDLLKKISFKNVSKDSVMQRFLLVMKSAKKSLDIRSIKEVGGKARTKSSVGNPMTKLTVETYNKSSKEITTFTALMEFDKNVWKFAGEKYDKPTVLDEVETSDDQGNHRLVPETTKHLPNEPKQNASR